jgi:hypothetical protein
MIKREALEQLNIDLYWRMCRRIVQFVLTRRISGEQVSQPGWLVRQLDRTRFAPAESVNHP